MSVEDCRIVGRGTHSANHMAKLRPEIERLCQQHNFKYFVEDNEGRILVRFGESGQATSFWNQQQQQSPGNTQGYAQSSNPKPQQSYQQHQQGVGQSNDFVEQAVAKTAPMIFKKLMSCCTIM